MKYFNGIIILSFVSIIFVETGYAYLDPGAGSYVLQIVIAFVFGGLVAIKMFWVKIRTFLGNFFYGKERK